MDFKKSPLPNFRIFASLIKSLGYRPNLFGLKETQSARHVFIISFLQVVVEVRVCLSALRGHRQLPARRRVSRIRPTVKVEAPTVSDARFPGQGWDWESSLRSLVGSSRSRSSLTPDDLSPRSLLRRQVLIIPPLRFDWKNLSLGSGTPRIQGQKKGINNKM